MQKTVVIEIPVATADILAAVLGRVLEELESCADYIDEDEWGETAMFDAHRGDTRDGLKEMGTVVGEVLHTIYKQTPTKRKKRGRSI